MGAGGPGGLVRERGRGLVDPPHSKQGDPLIRHTLREAFLNLWRNRFMNLVASCAIAVSLLVLGLFLLLAHNLNRVVTEVGSQVMVSVYLRADATEQQLNQILASLRGREEVASTEYLSKQAAQGG